MDRLTTLINHFNLSVRSTPLSEATLIVTAAEDGTPRMVILRATAGSPEISPKRILFAAVIDWGGMSNPLIAALPTTVEIDISSDAESMGLITLMQSELAAQRCGAGPVISRLGEILIVRMLRAQIEAGSTQPGLLAGLSDPRLSRAIVAIHDHPGRSWRNEDLAQIAGLSLSRFAEVFLNIVGEPPAAYLRRWRLTLARQDVAKGDRVDAIARRYGYVSSEGFARAFKKHFGENPITLRPKRVA
ncbi:MAG: helix-turn-helix transcriptional regulator [Rhodobacteraceae bacterium]|nr:helix-turn-helix transcriptional regulator [Paracoccaceae bacterium]